MQNVADPLYQKTGPLDPSQDAANVPANQWSNTGQPPPATPQPNGSFRAQQQQASPPASQVASQTTTQVLPQPPARPAAQQDEFADSPDDQYYQDPQTGQYFPGYMKPQPEELVFGWVAPDRPFKQRKKQFFMTASTIAALICLILFFAGQVLPMAVVIAVLFVIYMLYTFPPHQITNQITTYGIRNENNLYYWEELGRFWFEQKLGNEIVLIEVSRFPNRLTLVLGEADRATIEAILSEVLLQEKPPLSPVEKAALWLQDKVPLDLDE